jgi:carboxyl-terminal processing protease
MKQRFHLLLLLILSVASLVGGTVESKVAAVSNPNKSKTAQFLETYTEAINIIDRYYAADVASEKLVYGSIRRMLQTLDPHSSFFDQREYSRLREEQHSKYSGLGIRIRPLVPGSGRVVIYEPPDPGTPAYRKGLRAGDVISKIEGASIEEWTQDEVINHLRGPKGTKVNITIDRPSLNRPLDIEIVRDEIRLYTVPYAFLIRPGIGYIKVDRFSDTTSDELSDKLKAFGDNNLKGLILDLRDNPGGLLQQAIEVSDLFIGKNKVIVSTKGREDSSRKNITAPGRNGFDFPLVVLINRSSASASEIVAGAVQDHDRGLIVGETSFGKGLVQSVYTLDNGTGLALTTAKYYTPSGRLIQRHYDSDSVFEYYNAARSRNQVAETTTTRDVAYTDNGRKVLGGGGINPDVTVTARELNRFEMTLATKDVFFEYARELKNGNVAAASNIQLPVQKPEVTSEGDSANRNIIVKSFQITPQIIEDFKRFLRAKKIEFTDREIADSLEFIKRKIKQEVFISTFGLQEGYKVGIEGDDQVMKALSLMPEAEQLLASSTNYKRQ